MLKTHPSLVMAREWDLFPSAAIHFSLNSSSVFQVCDATREGHFKIKCSSKYVPFLPDILHKLMKAMKMVCMVSSSNVRMLLEMPRFRLGIKTYQICFRTRHEHTKVTVRPQCIHAKSIHSWRPIPSQLSRWKQEEGAKSYPFLPLLPFAVRAGRTCSRDVL